jgi:hypothetical protein
MPSAEQYNNRRQAYAAWLTANGINPNNVPRDAVITISEGTAGRLLCCEVFDLTPDGHRQLDERGEKAAVTVVAVPLKVEPPNWWESYEKPTRDELLAVVDRVEQLAERWKYIGDRKNGPRQELLQALGKPAAPENP